MSYRIDPQIYQIFKGIREYNGVNTGGVISAIKCNNVDFVQSEIGNAVSIRTTLGNQLYKTLPAGYKVIGVYESEQEGITYTFIYGENETKGTLFYIDTAGNVTSIIDDLSVTGKSNGLTMTSTAYDIFVFTNGVDAKTVCFTSDSGYGETVKTITAKDYLGRSIHWLSMTNWNGFLVVASEYGVHSSHQNDIYKWNDNPQDVADSWYIDFSKKITAVISFTNGLYIFSKDDLTFLNTTPNDTSSSMQTAAMNGCFSYESIIKHDTYLFFYDENQKNIYYLTITDTGQTRPTGPAAKEVQSYFNHVKRFKMCSCITGERNEIWCLINDTILVFDYNQQEWTRRTEQLINCVGFVENGLLTGDNNGNIYREYINDTFNGEFYDCCYETTMVNLGTNTNMKKQKTPLLITLDTNYTNDFWVQLIRDGKEKTAKHIKVNVLANGEYGSADSEAKINNTFDSARFALETTYKKKVVEVSTPQTWYTLAIRIFTLSKGQSFFINSIEMKNIKGKTKTKGR